MVFLIYGNRKLMLALLCMISVLALVPVIFLMNMRLKSGISTNGKAFFVMPSFISHSLESAQPTGDFEAKTSVYFANQTTGGLNAHVWFELCGFYVHQLQQTPLFPQSPHRRIFIPDFKSTLSGTQFGQRIFGFLHPRTTGVYQFAISSDDTSELWLSFDEDPTRVKLVASVSSPESPAWSAYGDYKKYPTQISRKIHLEASRSYFIEVLHKQAAGEGHVEVYWKLQGSDSFEIIRGMYLSPFYSADLNEVGENFFRDHDNMGTQKTSDYFPWVNVSGVLPTCPYEPSVIVHRQLKKYEGVRLIHPSSVWPKDETSFDIKSTDEWFAGNALVDERKVHLVVRKFVDALEKHHSRKYSLQKVIKLDQTVDKEKGDRFFLELQLGLLAHNNRSLRLSEYVFMKNGSSELCFPEDYQWYRNATIYFILPVKNQGGWVLHFLKEMTRLHDKTWDDNFVVIIIDFASDDVDVEKMLNASPIRPKIILIKKSGPFHKTLAIQEAASRVPHPHDIVFLFDLHIDVPLDLLDSIRKRVIQGKMAYSPVVGRLDCGSFKDNPKGFWQLNGFGVMAVYKSDWDRFKGMNVRDFTTKWGGEDWDLVDRIVGSQLEILQLKQQGFLHYYHTHNRMWNL